MRERLGDAAGRTRMADDGRQSLWTGIQRTANEEDIEDIEIALPDNAIWTSQGRNEMKQDCEREHGLVKENPIRRYEEDGLEIYQPGPRSGQQRSGAKQRITETTRRDQHAKGTVPVVPLQPIS